MPEKWEWLPLAKEQFITSSCISIRVDFNIAKSVNIDIFLQFGTDESISIFRSRRIFVYL